MSNELRIPVYGSVINLFVTRILKRQKESMLKYCEENNKKLKRIWYFSDENDQKFLQDLFQINGRWNWYTTDNILEVNGPVIDNEDEIGAFLMGTMERPRIQEIYLNGIKKYDPSKIGWYYHQKVDLPSRKEGQVFLYYGFIDRMGLTYRFRTESEDFDEQDLSCYFTDYGEYGIVLSSMIYKDVAAEKSFEGSATVHFLDIKFS